MKRTALLLGATLLACGCDGATMLQLRIEQEVTASSPIVDELWVTVTAASEETGGTPTVFQAEPIIAFIDDEFEFPLLIDVEQGSVYTDWIAYQIVGKVDDDDVYRRYGREEWPDSDYREVQIDLTADCYGQECDPGQHCVTTGCVDVPGGICEAFDGGAESCDAEEPQE